MKKSFYHNNIYLYLAVVANQSYIIIASWWVKKKKNNNSLVLVYLYKLNSNHNNHNNIIIVIDHFHIRHGRFRTFLYNKTYEYWLGIVLFMVFFCKKKRGERNDMRWKYEKLFLCFFFQSRWSTRFTAGDRAAEWKNNAGIKIEEGEVGKLHIHIYKSISSYIIRAKTRFILSEDRTLLNQIIMIMVNIN